MTINVWPNPEVGSTVTLSSGAVIPVGGAAVTDTAEITNLLRARVLLSADPTGVNPNPIPLPSGYGPGSLSLATYAALQAYVSGQDGLMAYVRGYAADNDGGEGSWRLSTASTATVDGGTVLAASPAGRWLRVWDQVNVRADWFGPGSTTCIRSAINRLMTYPVPTAANHTPGKVILGPYTYTPSTSIQIFGPVSLVGQGPSVTTILNNGLNATFGIVTDVFNARDAYGTGAVAAGQKTFTVNSSSGYTVGARVYCLMGSDPYDSNEPGAYWFDVVESIPDSTHITLRNGSPEALPDPALGAVIWGGKSHIYLPDDIADGIEIGGFTLDTVLGVTSQGLGNIWYLNNSRVHDICVRNTQGGFAFAGCMNFTVERITYERSDTYAPDLLVSGRLMSLNGCRNVQIRSIRADRVDRTAFFFESQNRGIALDGIDLRSTNPAVDPGSNFFHVVGHSTGIVARNVRVNSTVARLFATVGENSEFDTENLTVDGRSCTYLDLSRHSGQLSINGTVYGPRKRWTGAYPCPASNTNYTDLPKGAYAVVRSKCNSASNWSGLYLVPTNAVGTGINFNANVSSLNTLIDSQVGMGTLQGLYGDDGKTLGLLSTGAAPLNSYLHLEIEYFPSLGDDNTFGLTKRRELGDVTVGPWYGTAAPVSGTWARGDQVFNTNAAVGAAKSWVCTVAGTPGTWVSTGNL